MIKLVNKWLFSPSRKTAGCKWIIGILQKRFKVKLFFQKSCGFWISKLPTERATEGVHKKSFREILVKSLKYRWPWKFYVFSGTAWFIMMRVKWLSVWFSGFLTSCYTNLKMCNQSCFFSINLEGIFRCFTANNENLTSRTKLLPVETKVYWFAGKTSWLASIRLMH